MFLETRTLLHAANVRCGRRGSRSTCQNRQGTSENADRTRCSPSKPTHQTITLHYTWVRISLRVQCVAGPCYELALDVKRCWTVKVPTEPPSASPPSPLKARQSVRYIRYDLSSLKPVTTNCLLIPALNRRKFDEKFFGHMSTYLKRGLKRRSCDFCFRRKVRCDWSSRKSDGHGRCSHCELRQISCTTTDLASGRGRNRRGTSSRTWPVDDSITITPSRQPATSDDSENEDRTGPTHAVDVANDIISSPLTAEVPNVESHNVSTPITDTPDPTQPIDSIWQDIDWELGIHSIAFLDSIFAQNHDLDIMSSTSHVTLNEKDTVAVQSPYEISEFGTKYT